MTMLVAVIVWVAIYPNAVSVAEQTGDYSGQLAVLPPTSTTMHPDPNPDPNPAPEPPNPTLTPTPTLPPTKPHQVLSLTSITMHPDPYPDPDPNPEPQPKSEP